MASPAASSPWKKERVMLMSFVLRTGLALAFFYAAISSWLAPAVWIGFIPPWVSRLIHPLLFLRLHSLGEIALGLWLLSNKKIFSAAVIAALAMLSIVVFNLGALDIVFRDVAIFCMALALAVLAYERR